MIVEWLASVGLTIAQFFASLFQSFQMPQWVTDTVNGLASFLGSASNLGAWVPIAVINAVLATIALVYGITFGAKLVQKVWGLVPVVGGSG